MPTAISAHKKRNVRTIKIKIAIEYDFFLHRSLANSNKEPKTKRSIPITIKSLALQFTSSVNCIAINGMDRISATGNRTRKILELFNMLEKTIAGSIH